MPDFSVLEPVIDPANKITFLLDWELTMKCNLDCSYCPSGLHGGHDNSTAHPPLTQVVDSIDFMFAYADLYMSYKPQGLKYVVLNVYGGEALHYPDVELVLEEVRKKYKPYQHKWHLTVTSTTNLILTEKKLEKVLPYIDEFTVSFHAESTAKQQEQFKKNILTLKESGVRIKCIVMMHNRTDLFPVCLEMIQWLQSQNIKYLPKQIDSETTNLYHQEQVVWFDKFYGSQSIPKNLIGQDRVDLSETGRACCGGRAMCQDNNRSQKQTWVLDNKFQGWSCSVNWFFLFVKQYNNEIYVNKDCKMRFDGTVGPIGILSESEKILEDLKSNLENKSLPVITCAKHKCHCGLCAPKAQTPELFNQMFSKYTKDYYQ